MHLTAHSRAIANLCEQRMSTSCWQIILFFWRSATLVCVVCMHVWSNCIPKCCRTNVDISVIYTSPDSTYTLCDWFHSWLVPTRQLLRLWPNKGGSAPLFSYWGTELPLVPYFQYLGLVPQGGRGSTFIISNYSIFNSTGSSCGSKRSTLNDELGTPGSSWSTPINLCTSVGTIIISNIPVYIIVYLPTRYQYRYVLIKYR